MLDRILTKPRPSPQKLKYTLNSEIFDKTKKLCILFHKAFLSFLVGCFLSLIKELFKNNSQLPRLTSTGVIFILVGLLSAFITLLSISFTAGVWPAALETRNIPNLQIIPAGLQRGVGEIADRQAQLTARVLLIEVRVSAE
jgi:hypothetical protein